MVLHVRISEPDSLNIVSQDMNDKGITETTLLFQQNVNDNEFILKVSSQNCKYDANMPLNAGFEKDVKYNIDVEFKRYTTKENNGYTCIFQNIINTSNNNKYR